MNSGSMLPPRDGTRPGFQITVECKDRSGDVPMRLDGALPRDKLTGGIQNECLRIQGRFGIQPAHNEKVIRCSVLTDTPFNLDLRRFWKPEPLREIMCYGREGSVIHTHTRVSDHDKFAFQDGELCFTITVRELRFPAPQLGAGGMGGAPASGPGPASSAGAAAGGATARTKQSVLDGTHSRFPRNVSRRISAAAAGGSTSASSSTQTDATQFQMPECAICLDPEKRATHFFVPCGHMGCCASCAQEIFQNTERRSGADGRFSADATNACPWCRNPITAIVKVQVIV